MASVVVGCSDPGVLEAVEAATLELYGGADVYGMDARAEVEGEGPERFGMRGAVRQIELLKEWRPTTDYFVGIEHMVCNIGSATLVDFGVVHVQTQGGARGVATTQGVHVPLRLFELAARSDGAIHDVDPNAHKRCSAGRSTRTTLLARAAVLAFADADQCIG